MAFLIFMIILHLYSDPCFCQPTMDDAATGMKCSKCIVGTKARESICSDCTRGGDNADKPFTCRSCDIGASSAQPFLCRRCINSNTNADINSSRPDWIDKLYTKLSSEHRVGCTLLHTWCTDKYEDDIQVPSCAVLGCDWLSWLMCEEQICMKCACARCDVRGL